MQIISNKTASIKNMIGNALRTAKIVKQHKNLKIA